MKQLPETYNPILYEINTRLLVRRFSLQDRSNALLRVPDSYWRSLADKGVDYLWLMGIWQTAETGFAGCVYHPDDLKRYQEALPDLTEEDLLGSPYAIDQYIPDPLFGDIQALKRHKKQLNKRGLRLILDFVPNHFGRNSRHVTTNPGFFLQGSELQLIQHPEAFHQINSTIFAKARDPYFPPWQDTVQVNYHNPKARQWMIAQLLEIATYCDGVRCDMAMLATRSVYTATWSWLTQGEEWELEFWEEAIQFVRAVNPDFMFLAECYWEMQDQLLEMGFDYCYDKSVLDDLKATDIESLNSTLNKPASFLSGSAHFLENHDEERARSVFALEQHICSAVFCYTLPGLRFFHDGQWEGARTRIPVQLGRAMRDQPCTCPLALELTPNSESRPACACIALFYQRFMELLNDKIFKLGIWTLCQQEDFKPTPHNNELFFWEWAHDETYCLIITNLGQEAITITMSSYCSQRQLQPRALELLSEMQIPIKQVTVYPRQAMICRFKNIR